MARNWTKKTIHSPLLLRPNKRDFTLYYDRKPTNCATRLSFIRHNLVLSLRLMHCFANARQCVGGLHSDLLTFLLPCTELFWDFSFNLKRTIALRMSSSHKYFPGVQYCKNKKRWMCSKAFKWTMDSVTTPCAYYLCKIQGFPDTESNLNVSNFQRKRVENGK